MLEKVVSTQDEPIVERRSGIDRRRFTYNGHLPDRRRGGDRRSRSRDESVQQAGKPVKNWRDRGIRSFLAGWRSPSEAVSPKAKIIL